MKATLLWDIFYVNSLIYNNGGTMNMNQINF